MHGTSNLDRFETLRLNKCHEAVVPVLRRCVLFVSFVYDRNAVGIGARGADQIGCIDGI